MVTYPGEKVQIDIKYVPNNIVLFGLKDQNYNQITEIDEYTRKRVLEIDDKRSETNTTNIIEKIIDLKKFFIKFLSSF